ncbi:PadR family transcriptional regulator [Candidatus Woesearchaeota archaeon]|nr:PadR family transcriptional regulator [Candidatus Woesearchaeota archaeon]
MAVKITNMVKFYTILLLNSRPMHGYEIIMEIGDKLGRKISAGQIYPFLQSLEKNRYIVHGTPKAREKKQYRLTPAGRKFVLDVIEKFGGVLDSLIETKVRVCVHCRARVLGLGHVEKIKGASLVFCCPYCAASYKKSG